MPLEMQNVHTDISYQQVYPNQSSMPSHQLCMPCEMQNVHTVGATIPPPPPGDPPLGIDQNGRPSAPRYNPGYVPSPSYAVPQTVYPDQFTNRLPTQPYQVSVPQNVYPNPYTNRLATQPYQVSVYRVPGFWDNGGFYEAHVNTIWIGGLTVIVFIFWMAIFWQNS
jgi:hypothetical protein